MVQVVTVIYFVTLDFIRRGLLLVHHSFYNKSFAQITNAYFTTVVTAIIRIKMLFCTIGNYEVFFQDSCTELLPRSHYGTFYDADAYLVYSCSLPGQPAGPDVIVSVILLISTYKYYNHLLLICCSYYFTFLGQNG